MPLPPTRLVTQESIASSIVSTPYQGRGVDPELGPVEAAIGFERWNQIRVGLDDNVVSGLRQPAVNVARHDPDATPELDDRKRGNEARLHQSKLGRLVQAEADRGLVARSDQGVVEGERETVDSDLVAADLDQTTNQPAVVNRRARQPARQGDCPAGGL